VVDMVFLHGFDSPTLAVIYDTTERSSEGRCLRTHALNLKEKELTPGPWSSIGIVVVVVRERERV
jgi:hypothetical protein